MECRHLQFMQNKKYFLKASGSYMKTFESVLLVDDLKLNSSMLLNPETTEKGYYLCPLAPFLYNYKYIL